MFGHNFYHSTIRKYVALFGTIFNDIHIQRSDSIIKVPINYGPRDKVLARLEADPNFDRPAVILPRMSFEITNIQYAAERKLNTLHRRAHVNTTDPDTIKYQYNPVPYDISFELSIMVKSTEDGTRIVEQILPFFTPEWTSTVELIPEMNIVMDIPIVLNRVSIDDQYLGSFEERRALVWTLGFTMKSYIFGPIRSSKVIKFTDANLYSNLTSNTLVSTVSVVPGLDANGNPTSSNTTTIDAGDIYGDDDYGYIVTITDA